MDREQRLDEVITAYLKDAEAGRAPDPELWLARHPDLADDLRDFLAQQRSLERVAAPLRQLAPPAPAIAADQPTLASGQTAIIPPSPTTVRYFGDYELLEEVARGGMGVVYKAQQVSLHRVVALKMILAGQLAGPGDVQRFRQEAEAAANLDHPHIVPIYEVGEYDGQHYFAMKFIDGVSLSQRIEHYQGDYQGTAHLLETIARAVHHAHQRGILHRDLKPGNVLFDAAGEAYLTDFGLAARLEGHSGMTQTGAIVGTPSYMAPEQARAEKGLSVRADVYALGAVLYECLTGQPPFRAGTPLDTLVQVLEREPEAPSRLRGEVPSDLETVCLKCLHKEPGKRYASALDLAEDLRRFREGEPITARPVGRVERGWRWCKRKPAVAGLLATVVLVLVAGIAFSTYFGINASLRAEAERSAKESALQHEQQALEAQVRERDQRQLAEKREREARWNLYVARLYTMAPLWQRREFGQLQRELDRHTPRGGEPDFRGWEWQYFRDQCEQNLHTLSSTHEMRYALWSPDGKWLATRRASDSAVLIWDPETWKVTHTFPSQWGWEMAWSPDSKMIVARSGADRLEIWEVPSGKKVRTITNPKPLYNVIRKHGLAWSRDGQRIAQGGSGWLDLWSVGGTLLHTLRLEGSSRDSTIHGLDWHPRDNRLDVRFASPLPVPSRPLQLCFPMFSGDSSTQNWRRICETDI